MTCTKRLNLALLALLLSACAAPDPSRVAVTMMGTQGVGQANDMVARAGETPESMARKTNLDISSLLQMNGLVSQQRIQPGLRLKTPLPTQISVIEGDSIDTIARALGVSRNDIASANNMKPPYILRRGQVLQLPTQAMAANASQAVEIPSAITVTDLPPTDPVVSASPIVTTENATGAKVHSSASGVITEEELAPPPGAKTATTNAPMLPSSITPPTEVASITPPAKPITTLGAGVPRFSWPVNGSTLSNYGSQSGGRQNDGINIGAPLGSPVRAAAPGEVVYVGDNIAGFGNLVLIRHSGGYATAYGHIQNPTVKRGEKVSAGQAIAQIGKTGNVDTPQLHFEIRKGTQPTDPSVYLP